MPRSSREKKRKTTQAQAFLVSTSDPLSTVVWTLRDVLKQLDVAGRTTKVCPVEERALATSVDVCCCGLACAPLVSRCCRHLCVE
jgi:hypothetical protein